MSSRKRRAASAQSPAWPIAHASMLRLKSVVGWSGPRAGVSSGDELAEEAGGLGPVTGLADRPRAAVAADEREGVVGTEDAGLLGDEFAAEAGGLGPVAAQSLRRASAASSPDPVVRVITSRRALRHRKHRAIALLRGP